MTATMWKETKKEVMFYQNWPGDADWSELLDPLKEHGPVDDD